MWTIETISLLCLGSEMRIELTVGLGTDGQVRLSVSSWFESRGIAKLLGLEAKSMEEEEEDAEWSEIGFKAASSTIAFSRWFRRQLNLK